MSRIVLASLALLFLTACGDSTETDAGATARAEAPASRADAAQHSEAAQGPALASATGADLANGQRQFRRCQTCHTINEHGRHTVGPNLYGVIGRPAASAPGFSYSGALSQSGLVWTRETLNEWINNPRVMVPGNRMSFVGLRDADDRRDVIAYIASVTRHDDDGHDGDRHDRDGHDGD